MFDRAQIKYEIYLRLNKSPVTPGFFTSEHVDSAIAEALDLVAAEMFAVDMGWSKKLDFLDVPANALTIPVPPHMAIIEKLSYLIGNVYIPLAYDSQWDTPQWSVTTGATQLPGNYRIVDNRFYFAPALAVGGSNYLQVEYQAYPQILRSDSQKIDPQFDRAMIYYIIYRACSILASAIGQDVKSWQVEEALWHQKMVDITNKRVAQSIPIKSFSGY